MKAKEIQDLIDFISKTGLNEVKIETEALKLSIKKNTDRIIEQVISSSGQSSSPAPAPSAPAPAAPAAPAAPVETPPAAEDNYITVKSPMIGTFYRSTDPESDPFVSVGSSISVGDPVCIIEAMKLFNEIESEISGKIVKVLVDDATPVEYDQPLFLVDPS